MSSSSSEVEVGASEKWLGSSTSISNSNSNENESSENLPQSKSRSSLAASSPPGITAQSAMETDRNIPPSARQDMNYHSNNNNERGSDEDGESDSDSDIEFLLTILPPSPQKTKNSSMLTPEQNTVVERSSTRNTRSSGSFKPPQQQEESENSSKIATNDTLLSPSPYTSASQPLDSDCHDSLQQQYIQTRTSTSREMNDAADAKGISNVLPLSSPNKQLLSTTVDDDKQRVSSAVCTEKAEPSPNAATKLLSAPDQSYSKHRRSAYLQSLAEICYAVLWDARWRVGLEQKRLLAWERGDDLSVVCTLAEQYIPINIPKAPQSAGKHATRQSEETPTLEIGKKSNTATEATSIEMGTPNDTSDIKDGADRSDVINASGGSQQEDPHSRRLNLYCRLYYRKGPYFRVDDVFDRYYSSKGNSKETHHSTASASLSDPNPTAEEKISESEPTKKDERLDFFRPQKKKKMDHSISKNPSNLSGDIRKTVEDNSLLDIEMLHRQLDTVCSFVEDWRALHDMGFFRTFVDEEECGQTIGIRNGILKQDEQNQILQLLGCKKKHGSQKSSRNDQTTDSNAPLSENLIWKQMVHQTTISFAASAAMGAGIGSVLPVIKHMRETILRSWARSIVLKSSKRDYIPNATLRSLTMQVKSKLVEVIRAVSDGGLDGFSCCSRLREPPLNSLRRCFRLYLCATSGPGSMRGDDNTAWKSLPESHTKDLTNLPFQRMIPPPGSHSWNKILCPGKDYRFKITSCNFIRAHKSLDLKCDQYCAKGYDWKLIQAFQTLEAFTVWEHTSDVRANVDYLMMLKDLLRSNERKRSRENNGEQYIVDNEISPTVNVESVTVDFHDLLTENGRVTMVQKLFLDLEPEHLGIAAILRDIENDVERMEAGFAEEENSGKLSVECDKVLGVIAILSLHILAACSVHTGGERLLLYQKRPWLRHLRWEGCLAYILWDTIKTLECKLDGFYELAVKALNVLLFGQAVMPSELDCNKMLTAKLMPLLLSRRAKGKAYERLALDYLHHLRQKRQKEELVMLTENERKKGTRRLKRARAKDCTEKNQPTPNEVVAKLSQDLILVCAGRAQIPFSAVRTIARRLKRPLAKTMEGIVSPETVELGHRYSNGSPVSSTANKTRYNDWIPATDLAIANAMITEYDNVGKRCSYIGFEDNSINIGSLNVEELAMEFYRTGRLPREDSTGQKGGWVGWHDEGGKVRQLWRILSSPRVLGMDFGPIDDAQSVEMATIHLTPYQGAPFDLHCGTEYENDMVAKRGFYDRRKNSIDLFLDRIASLRPSELADLVYSSVETRLLFAREHPDLTLHRDVEQVRSLSFLAAGIGGKLLSTIFRCFFYDYRHYSGGLPDLTLVRALSAGSIVDLGELIGEGFHPDAEKETNVLEDRDSEFLGCSKVGDSGSRGINQLRRGQQKRDRELDHQSRETRKMPKKLDLLWHGDPVKAECMFVEVKSANDRLDPRQEDWLNILDIHGNARVCKFGTKKK